MSTRALIEGDPVLVVLRRHDREFPVIPRLIEAARRQDIPIVFALESGQNFKDQVGRRTNDYSIRPPRFSVFFGTELPILLRDLGASTLILAGGQTSISVHYSFVDAHQHDYFCRVVEDSMEGSSPAAHEAALRAMEYMQTGARQNAETVVAALSAVGQGRRADR